MHTLFLQYIVVWKPLGYILAFIALALEGEGPLFVFGFLTAQGFFDPFLMFLVLYAGTVFGDAGWFALGHYVTRFKVLRIWADRLATPFDEHLRERPFKTIFFSQFIYGIHHAIWVRAGSLGLPFVRLMRPDALASIFWVFIVGGLGNGASLSLWPIAKFLRYGEIILLFGLILFILFQKFVTKYIRRRL